MQFSPFGYFILGKCFLTLLYLSHSMSSQHTEVPFSTSPYLTSMEFGVRVATRQK
jgi:hypothetical protein